MFREEIKSLLGDLFQGTVTEISCSWNDQFQKILGISDEEIKNEELFDLGKNFEESATKYAKIIISEFHLPHDKKTIKQANVGGLAGGVKFICNDILFKFAIDNRNLYGGGKIFYFKFFIFLIFKIRSKRNEECRT